MASRPTVTWQLIFQPGVVNKLSHIEPYNKCTCQFWVDVNFKEFRARIAKEGQPLDPFTGLMIHNIFDGTTGSTYSFDIVSESHMLEGEGMYIVGLYAKDENGHWNVGGYLKVSNGGFFLVQPGQSKVVVKDS